MMTSYSGRIRIRSSQNPSQPGRVDPSKFHDVDPVRVDRVDSCWLGAITLILLGQTDSAQVRMNRSTQFASWVGSWFIGRTGSRWFQRIGAKLGIRRNWGHQRKSEQKSALKNRSRKIVCNGKPHYPSNFGPQKPRDVLFGSDKSCSLKFIQ